MTRDEGDSVVHQAQEELEEHRAVSFAVVSHQ